LRILLDTNVLLWTLAGSNRVKAIKPLLLDDMNEVFVSTASWWEIAIKASIGKLDADVASLRIAAHESGFVELGVLGAHTEVLATLPLLHRDPFDRLIVSQAIYEPMQLLTSDEQLGQYSDLVKII
jgi:PIN domain nuclease of toxin-antitoxin system